MKKSISKRIAMSILLGAGVMTFGMNMPSVEAANLDLKTTEVVYDGISPADVEEIKGLLPELNNKTVNVNKLSKQIMLVNDSKAMKLSTDFKPQKDGTFKVIVKQEKLKNDKASLTVNNSGNEYTGEWRGIFNYTNTDITKHGDALSVTYGTAFQSMSDVHQAAVAYKWLMPKAGDTAYISAVYSDADTDMGNIYSIGDFDLRTNGTYKDFGFHYQHNFKYTSARKQLLDIGLNYKMYDGYNIMRYSQWSLPLGNFDFTENVLALTYYDMIRSQNQAFSYNVGLVYNLNGDEVGYTNYRGATNFKVKDNFTIFRAGLNYQYRTMKDWILWARVNGQYTNDDLISLEQLGAGGMNSVRGFQERIASGDYGVLGSFEIYTPEIAPHQRFLAFIDAASLSNNHYRIGEEHRSLSSWGLGYRLVDKDKLDVSLNYAFPISTGDIDMSKYGRRWTLNVTYKF